MTPEVINFNPIGHHNADLTVSAARIMESGSWKNQRVVMIVPAGKMMPTKVALAMRALIFPPNQAMTPWGAIGAEVGEAYSAAIEAILSNPVVSQWEYIFTLEHDNLGPADGVVKLIERMEAHPEFACIGGLYWTKGYGGVPQIWGDPRDPSINFRPQPPDSNGGLVECCGTGMGFNLWRMSMFRDPKLRRPWFKTINGLNGKGVGTQDLYFWGDARLHGYRCAVDCSVRVGHYDVEADRIW